MNIIFNSAALVGLFLMVAGAGLYFLRSMRPELSRDYDIFFSAAGLVCGGIFLFYGWTMSQAAQVGLIILTGSTIFFAVEGIRLRGISTEKARRNTRVVDRDRPVSKTRVYQEAELDRIQSYEGGEPNYDSPMLRGYQEPAPRRRKPSAYEPEEQRRNYRSRSSRSDRYAYEETARKRRYSRNEAPQSDRYEGWEEPQDRWQEQRPLESPTRSRRRPPLEKDDYNRQDLSATRLPRRSSRRSRSETERPSRGNYRPTPTDVDYYPLDDRDNPKRDRY